MHAVQAVTRQTQVDLEEKLLNLVKILSEIPPEKGPRIKNKEEADVPAFLRRMMD